MNFRDCNRCRGGRWSVVVDGGRRRQRRLAVTVGTTCGLVRSYFVIAEVGSKFVHLRPGRGGAGGRGGGITMRGYGITFA